MIRSKCALPALVAALIASAPAHATIESASTDRTRNDASVAAAAGDCHAHFANAEDRFGIPSGLLSAITDIESGGNPLALNVGGRTMVPQSYDHAASLLFDGRGRPRRDVTVGCMQIHTGAHLAAVGNRPERLLNPRVNVNYAANMLRNLYDQHGSWRAAVGWYHTGSGTARAGRYICAVDRRLQSSGADARLNCR